MAKLGKSTQDTYNQGGWLILKNGVAEGVASDPHDTNIYVLKLCIFYLKSRWSNCHRWKKRCRGFWNFAICPASPQFQHGGMWNNPQNSSFNSALGKCLFSQETAQTWLWRLKNHWRFEILASPFKIFLLKLRHCTEMRFASFFSGGFISSKSTGKLSGKVHLCAL